MVIYSQDEADTLWQVGSDDALTFELFKGNKIRRAFDFTGLVTSSSDDKPAVEFPVTGIFYARRSTCRSLSVEVSSMWATEASRFPGMRADEQKRHFKDGTKWLIPKKPIRVNLWNLVVTQEEFARVSAKYELPFDAAPMQQQISTRERESLLRTIGVLVRMVVAQDPDQFKIKSSGRFNPSAVVRVILNHIDMNEIDTSGLGKKTLEMKLNAAFELVPRP